jgi:hypothetical protein
LTGVELALAVAALLIGLTGAWSPCGFSMVETIGPSGHTGGARTTAAALAAFVPGALAGGVATFASLAALGDLVHGAGGRLAYAAAALIAVLAALAEARGMPIVPQVRRQLPEHWRRVMPMPVAAFLYGILLGLGFTTFVLSFGVWALAGISFAIGDPLAGVAIGLAFGAGRAIPVLALAPVCERPSGVRATEAMTMRPALYRGARLGDATALALCAVLMVVAVPAGAAEPAALGAGDPSVSGRDMVFERTDGAAILRSGGKSSRLPGTEPAIGGPWIAVREGGAIALLQKKNLRERARLSAAPDAIAVSRYWLAYRTRENGVDVIRASRIGSGSLGPSGGVGSGASASTVLTPPGVVARAARGAALGRPSLFKSTLLYGRSSQRASSIVQTVLGKGRKSVLIGSHQWLVSSPSIRRRAFVYVRTTNERQQLRLRKMGAKGRGKVIYALPATSIRDKDHDPGHHRLPTRIPPPDRRRTQAIMWSTALAANSAYVTLLRQADGRRSARIVRVGR